MNHNQLPPLRLTGAKILLGDDLIDAPISIADGTLTDTQLPEIDLSGYWILPGIIDLHGDGFERHLQPRPGVHFSKSVGLQATDAELAANGVTTAVLAQCWSWLGGRRGPEFAEELLETWGQYKQNSLVDIQFQIRYETHMVDTVDHFLRVIREHNIGYVVYNNHINDASNAPSINPVAFARFAAEAGRTPEQHANVLEGMLGNSLRVEESLQEISKSLQAMGVKIGSHDDETASARKYFANLGADICEFPTSLEAAQQAREMRNPILMGAPNVMRGGSQSGNIAAQELIEAGLCDALVSDYYYPAMQGAVWALVDRGVLPLAQAWALVSTNPARILGLADRGELTIGARADLVIMNPETRQIEATISNGRLAGMGGSVGVRFAQRTELPSIAAE